MLLDGNEEYSATNFPAQDYTQYSLTYVPLSTTMTFTLLGSNDQGYLLLDDVSVVESAGEYLSSGQGGRGGN